MPASRSLIPYLLCCALPFASLAHASQPLFSHGLEGWTSPNTDIASFGYDAETDTLRIIGTQGWLRSPRDYGDFELRGQVRFVEADSDSGIFVRVEPGTDFIRGWPGNAYQVQMREISQNPGDTPLPLVHLYRHRVADGPTVYSRERVLALYTGVGQWQDFVIRVIGDSLTVDLNGERVTEASGLANLKGYLGFQSEKGMIEYRELTLEEL